MKLLTGRLTAYQHIKATSDSETCDNDYIRFRLGGVGVALVGFYDRWA